MNDIAPTGYIDFEAEARRDPASVPLALLPGMRLIDRGGARNAARYDYSKCRDV
jgi:hypothetical protein